MRVVVLVTDQDALASPPHAIFVIMFLQPLKPREDRRVFFWLRLLGPECVVGQRVESNGRRLVGGERRRKNRA